MTEFAKVLRGEGWERLTSIVRMPFHSPERASQDDRSAKDATFHLAANVSSGLFAALQGRNAFKTGF